MCGGTVLPTEYVASVGAVARDEAGAALHMDGARIWHAAAALGETLEQVAAPADSLSVCLSKAIGAPAGSGEYQRSNSGPCQPLLLLQASVCRLRPEFDPPSEQ